MLTFSVRVFSQAAMNTLRILFDFLQIFRQWTDHLHQSCLFLLIKLSSINNQQEPPVTGQCIFRFGTKVTFSLALLVDRLTVLLTRFFSISTLLSALSSRISFSLSRRLLTKNPVLSKTTGLQLPLNSSQWSTLTYSLFPSHWRFPCTLRWFLLWSELPTANEVPIHKPSAYTHTQNVESCTARLIFMFT